MSSNGGMTRTHYGRESPPRMSGGSGQGLRRWCIPGLLAAILFGMLAKGTRLEAHPLEVVATDHWTYIVLYRLASKELAPLWATSTRPLTRRELAGMVAQSLDRVSTHRHLFSQVDLEDVESLTLEFTNELALIGYHVIEPPQGPSVLALTGWGVRFDRIMVRRMETGRPPWFERQEGSALAFQPRAALGFGPTFMAGTEVTQSLAFGPNTTAGVRRLYLSGEVLGTSVQAGKDLLWWGPAARGAFLLSDHSGSLDFVRVSLAWDRLRYTKVLIPLDHQGRFLSGMRLDWLARDGLRIGLGETVVGAGGIYLPYVVNPLPILTYGISLRIRQDQLGYDDNYNISFDFDAIVRPGIVLYGELFIDDLTLPGNPFPSRLGGTAGLFFANPFRDDKTTVRLEHARVTNWVYTTSDPSGNYVRNGVALGHWCAPDCELSSAVLTHRLSAQSSVQVAYDLVRKGAGQLGQTWSSPEEAWAKLYLSGVVETTQALSVRFQWMQAPNLNEAVSVTWSTVANAGHLIGQSQQDWFVRWEASYGF